MNTPNKSVDIIIPCYNEENYIAKCLDNLLANDYPKNLIRINVIDGMSNDQTRKIVNSYSQKHSNISLLDNEHKIKPIALNIGINNSTGDYILRIDVHCEYPSDYIRKNIETITKYKADCCGGTIKVLPASKKTLSKILAYANSHFFSIGNAYYRCGTNKIREVNAVPFGCYRRELFSEIGMFNEKLIRAQDREIYCRMQQLSKKVLLNPAITSKYYLIRDNFFSYFIWMFQGGFWVFYASKLTGTKILSWRNYVPLLFVLYLFSLLPIIALYKANNVYTLMYCLPLLSYFLLDMLFAIAGAIKHRNLTFFPCLAIIFPLTHISYAFGSIHALLKRYSKPFPGDYQ